VILPPAHAPAAREEIEEAIGFLAREKAREVGQIGAGRRAVLDLAD
jgi:hypothetical protein